MASYADLVATADNLERYSQIYNQYRNQPFTVSASFTGGEPTVNPDFFKFLVYLQENYPHWKRTLTTNGFYSDRKLQIVMDNTDFTTVSYHCESSDEQKMQVRRNLQTMLDAGYNYKINIMFHENDNYFQECIALAQWCDDNAVKYTPRIIGDQEDIDLGIKQKTVHVYSESQTEWMRRFWDAKKLNSDRPAYDASEKSKSKSNQTEKNIVGQTIGRPCCGGREMEQMVDDEWVRNSFVENNNFQGWNCMINWYFLYIHQEIDKIWHHQTCQVNLNGEVGPICNVSNFGDFCDQLESKFSSGNIPFIRCPKTHCGCGLCVPKAKHDDLAKEIFNYHALKINPQFMDMKNNTHGGTLKRLVDQFDEENNNETD